VLVSHNAPLTVLSEMGLVGIGLLVWLLAAAALALRRAGAAADALGTRVALAALAAILVHSLLYAALFENPYSWVILAAGLLLAARVGTEEAVPSADAPARARGRLRLRQAHMLGR
jgi:O-antigen ligase